MGHFDEELVRNQDDEFNLRLTRAGGLIWQSPRIRSWYQPRTSLSALFRQYVQYGYWKVRVIQKHKLPASFRHLVPALFLMTLTALTLAAPFSKAALYAWGGLVGLYLVGTILASVRTARRGGIELLPILPAVFWCYHFGYGYGFLRGLWGWIIRGTSPSADLTRLTRTSPVPLGTRGNVRA